MARLLATHRLFAVLGFVGATFTAISAAALPSLASSVIPTAGEISCYNDESQDVVNQDRMERPPLGGPGIVPPPIDCDRIPRTTIDDKGSVKIGGRPAYDGFYDPAVEVRVTPGGIAAVKTQKGSLYRYSDLKGLERWYMAGLKPVANFKLSRTGELMAVTISSDLIIDGAILHNGEMVSELRTARQGLIAARLQDGRILTIDGHTYGSTSDPTIEMKIAENNTVAWITRSGKLATSGDQNMYGRTNSPIRAFRVNAGGDVAYFNSNGELFRNRERLFPNDHVQFVDCTISADGLVLGVDNTGFTWVSRKGQ